MSKGESVHVVHAIGTGRQVVGELGVPHLTFIANVRLVIAGRLQRDLRYNWGRGLEHGDEKARVVLVVMGDRHIFILFLWMSKLGVPLSRRPD